MGSKYLIHAPIKRALLLIVAVLGVALANQDIDSRLDFSKDPAYAHMSFMERIQYGVERTI